MQKDFFPDFRGTSKLEEAAELYISAGNMFKMAQKWSGSYHIFFIHICPVVPNYFMVS